MKTLSLTGILMTLIVTTTSSLFAQSPKATPALNTYLIEREIPGAGEWTPQQLKEISQTSCQVLNDMGTGIKWKHSYVADNKVFCIYQARDEDMIREHALKGGFPVTAIHLLASEISPKTAQE